MTTTLHTRTHRQPSSTQAPLSTDAPCALHAQWDKALAASVLNVLPPEQRAELLQNSRNISLSRGQRIFDEGHACQGMHVLLSGMVKLYHLTAEGKEMVLHLIRPGQCFGEAFVFRLGSQPDYPMSAAAVTPGAALFIPTEVMRGLVRRNADLAESMLTLLSTRIYMFTRKLQAHGLREAPQRLAAYLLHTSRMRGGTPHIQLDMSREMLANMLGTARETISRILTRLAEKEAIGVRGRQVHILNMDLLQRITDGDEEL